MTRVECEKGHIYDADMYSSCPYCGNFQTVDFGGMPVGEGGVTMPGGVPVGQGGVTMPGGSSMYNSMQRSVIDDESKTLPPRGYGMRVDAENKTTGMLKSYKGVEPVVGWLVCIEGSSKGKDYRLYGRINSIGRSEKMDVCIRGDSGITRDVHVKIGYDPKNNRFHIIPGNGANNTYVNDEPVYVQIKLNAYDVIEMGATKLLFIPLCGEKFSWSGGLNREGGDNAVF
ncbi:MAG: FHA domain-containing protein [Muribaculaceae bacterium]|nr:FHA domain-containing protein [Muribaculaceae bacterium]